MKDYELGNFLCEKREQKNLSQKQLAEMLGVTDKAVSKWENAKALPKTEIIRKMADIFDLSVDELLKMKEKNNIPEITKIVITGGPCGGKSTALSRIQDAFTDMGYTVLFACETATELITGGVAPWTCADNLDFQKNLAKLQI